ncbi:ABC transporter ATP-binding protein [Pseudoroseicyclus aestuarii]|nr:ABC transporter ATP-binding protein [Pseudoroseicyclus aestuarii]
MRLGWLADRIAPFTPGDGPPPRDLVPFLRWALTGSFGIMAVAGAVSVVAGILEVLAAGILGHVIDVALASEASSLFGENLWLMIGAAVFFIVARPLSQGLNALLQSVAVAPSSFTLVLSRLHRHTLGQAVTFFDNDFAGRISQKQMQAARAATDLATDFINTILFAIASVVGSLLLLTGIDVWAALMLSVWFFAYVVLIRIYMPKIRANSKARAAARAMVTGQVVDTISNIKTVKLFGHSAHEDRAAIQAMGRFRDSSTGFGLVSTGFRFWLMTLAGTLPVLLVGSTLWFWTRGQASPGDIAAVGAIALRLSQMTGWVSFTLMAMYSHVGEIEDAMQTLAPPHALTDAPDATELEVTEGAIRFDSVSFTYDSPHGGIRDIDLDIRAGEKLGLVGASGAGKSTLVAALLRLYDLEQGRITIDGQDIAHVTQDSLRRRIGMVTQDTAMFNRSARENIGYGAPDAEEGDIVAAARQAEADDFIRLLSDFKGREGYDAHLGERGVKLSGGQRQRIALARAMLKDAPILVLDEATSALDSEVEAQIQAALEQAMVGKTVIAIAHRLSTLAQMDRIVVMDQGRIVEQGTHDALLAQEGLYARYWARQSGGFIQEAAE